MVNYKGVRSAGCPPICEADAPTAFPTQVSGPRSAHTPCSSFIWNCPGVFNQPSIWLSNSRALQQTQHQGCIFCLTCSHSELTEDHVLTSAYVKIFRTVTRNAANKSVWRKKDFFWLPLNKHSMNIWLSSLKIRALQSWRTGKHLHDLHVLRTYSTCSYPGYQDTTTYAALVVTIESRILRGGNLLQVDVDKVTQVFLVKGLNMLKHFQVYWTQSLLNQLSFVKNQDNFAE